MGDVTEYDKIMKALIVDDERLARKELANLLKDHLEIEIIGEAVNADDAYQKIQDLDPDLRLNGAQPSVPDAPVQIHMGHPGLRRNRS